MKFEIYAQPRFSFNPTIADIDVLMKLSDGHYDLSCKLASRQGGFIYGWKNSLEFAKEWNEDHPNEKDEVCIVASWRDLDLCLKIMEMTGFLNAAEKEISCNLRTAFSQVMNRAQEMKTWKIEFDSAISTGQ